jgi:NADH:quinone reductase (non-electrogenic)
MHRMVIVGGGAGGLELATRLGDAYGAGRAPQQMVVTLVDRNPTHMWKPLLHEVAAGSIDPFTHQLEYAAQAHWHGFRFEQGELCGVDRENPQVLVGALTDEHGEEILPARLVPYDTLVLAIGSTTHYFNVKGAAEHSLALDTVAQAEQFRRRLIAAALRAGRAGHTDPQLRTAPRPRVNIAIVGAGATGVELSAELRSATAALAAYGLHRLDAQRDIGIVLIDSSERILPALTERVSATALGILQKRGIDVMLGERIVEVTANSLRTASGKLVHADLTVWAAGIRAPAVLSRLDGLAVNALGQLFVRPTLQTDGDDNIFAMGDCAACPLPDGGRTVPPRAQAAHQQASFLVKAMKCRLRGAPLPAFRYRDLGSLVSLGHTSAVGSLMGGLAGDSLFIGGIVARLMYKSLYRMHVAALHGWRRMVLNTIAHRLRRATMPRVKLH